jgi:uncharacterized protein (TIGR00251 family)
LRKTGTAVSNSSRLFAQAIRERLDDAQLKRIRCKDAGNTAANDAAPGPTAWLHRRDETAATLTLHVQPGARRTEVAGAHGDALKIRLAAPPVDGKANAALLEFIADRLGLPKSAVRLVRGQTSRRKILELTAIPPDAEQRLVTACKLIPFPDHS